MESEIQQPFWYLGKLLEIDTDCLAFEKLFSLLQS